MDDALKILTTALEWMASGRKTALATITQVSGSSPRPIGSQMVIDHTGRFEGSVSGGCVESTVVQEALDVIESKEPKTLFFSADDDQTWEVGLACGGQMEVTITPTEPMASTLKEIDQSGKANIPCGYISELGTGQTFLLIKDELSRIGDLPEDVREAVQKNWTVDHSMKIETASQAYFWSQYCPIPEILIIGAAHIAQPLVAIATTVGYQTTIIDPRQAFATKERFPDTRLIIEYPDDALNKRTIHSATAIVTLSHDPKIDDPALAVALKSKAFYIGALGSRKTHAARLERLKSLGFTAEELDRIQAPIGLKIGGKRIQEIAISIMAQIVQIKNTQE